MNRAVYEACQQDPSVKIVSILEPTPQKVEGTEVFNDAAKAFAVADVVIDFSTKEACVENMCTEASMGKNFVIGTTGISEDGLKRIRTAAAASKVSGVISGNFSVGVNVFIETVCHVPVMKSKKDASNFPSLLLSLYKVPFIVRNPPIGILASYS